MIVTIDGPAGAGKSTVARRLARRLELPYLNSGFIYRAVTSLLLERAHSPADLEPVFSDRSAVLSLLRGLELRFVEPEASAGPDASTRVLVGERELTDRLKHPEVTREIWRLANVPEYREALVGLQRSFATPGGVVAEGRDMGTVIFPDADAKFFIDASPEERARRQHAEALAAGNPIDPEELLRAILERDAHDRGRDVAPLVAADDAITILTDGLDVDEVVERVADELARGISPTTSRRPRE